MKKGGGFFIRFYERCSVLMNSLNGVRQCQTRSGFLKRYVDEARNHETGVT
jgi:hypothetical protein